jgi:hypothetical protein
MPRPLPISGILVSDWIYMATDSVNGVRGLQLPRRLLIRYITERCLFVFRDERTPVKIPGYLVLVNLMIISGCASSPDPLTEVCIIPHDFIPAADDQLGGIMKVYREWRISGNTHG